jgi:protein-disulfide isomerase
MRRFPRTPRGVLVLLGVSALTVVFAACGGSPTSPKIDPSLLPSMDLMLSEKTVGRATATHTIIEYSSFECPYCKDFHDTTFVQLKSTYIDPGLVKFVFRDSPLYAVDLTAAMLARCAGDRYFEAVDTLFANQSSWAGASDQIRALGDVMRNFGMSQGVIDACEASTALRNGILQMQQDGRQRWQYSGVPAFIVDDTRLVPDGFKYLSDFIPYLK